MVYYGSLSSTRQQQQGLVLLMHKVPERGEGHMALVWCSVAVRCGSQWPPNPNLQHPLKTSALFQLAKTSSKLCSSSLTLSSHNSCMQHNSLMHPIPGTAHPGGTSSIYEPSPTYVLLQQNQPFTMNLWAHLALEEWVMEEAKRLNKVALADMEPRQRNDQFQQTAALKYGVISQWLYRFV